MGKNNQNDKQHFFRCDASSRAGEQGDHLQAVHYELQGTRVTSRCQSAGSIDTESNKCLFSVRGAAADRNRAPEVNSGSRGAGIPGKSVGA